MSASRPPVTISTPNDERVAVDHPLDGVDVGVEVLLDRGQRDAQRGEVVGDDEHREAHRDEREDHVAIEGLLGGGGGGFQGAAGGLYSCVPITAVPAGGSTSICATSITRAMAM